MTDTARLGRTVLPVRYDLLVETDADISGFEGRVTITLDVTDTTSSVVLHAKELTVGLVSLEQDGEPIGAVLTAKPIASSSGRSVRSPRVRRSSRSPSAAR